MLERQAELEALRAEVLVVAYDDQSLLEAKMLHDLDLPFPLLLDPERTTYAAWGLGRTNLFGAMLSPSLNWRYFRLLLVGERFLGMAPDMLQLGGDFVIDAQGLICFAHRMRNNGDRASVARLFEALRTAAAD